MTSNMPMSKYDIEKATEKAHQTVMHAKLADVASKLGAFSYEIDEYGNAGTLHQIDGLQIRVNIGGYQHKGRIALSGVYGDLQPFLRYLNTTYVGGVGTRETRQDSITVSDSKTADQIVKDIKGRLLDNIQAERVIAIENRNTTHATQTARYATMQPLAEIMGATLRIDADKAKRGEDNPTISTYNPLVTVKCSHTGDFVSLDIHGVSPELAATILALINPRIVP